MGTRAGKFARSQDIEAAVSFQANPDAFEADDVDELDSHEYADEESVESRAAQQTDGQSWEDSSGPSACSEMPAN